jgi:hypothetical protein
MGPWVARSAVVVSVQSFVCHQLEDIDHRAHCLCSPDNRPLVRQVLPAAAEFAEAVCTRGCSLFWGETCAPCGEGGKGVRASVRTDLKNLQPTNLELFGRLEVQSPGIDYLQCSIRCNIERIIVL